MDNERAKEILNSYGVITVLYQGEPVWIEQIRDNSVAQVHYINSHRLDEIPVNLLVEE